MKPLFSYLIFPGFLFSAVIGLLAFGIERKLTARIQWRKGPPLTQNFWDILKLLGKETIVPFGARATFLFSPYLGLLSLVLAATILGKGIVSPLESFSGDLIVVIYLLVIPAIALIIGASASRNPLASVGASREMKMILAYELPFILSIVAIIIKSGGLIRIGDIVNRQINFGSNIFSFSGALAFFAVVFCMQAKLAFVPFDASEAEQEIMAGTLIEYSGLPLAVFKLTKAVMLYTMPVFLIVLFLGKDIGPVFLTLKFLALLILTVLIKNTSPRVRIDQAMRFFWRIPTVAAMLAVVLALLGK